MNTHVQEDQAVARIEEAIAKMKKVGDLQSEIVTVLGAAADSMDLGEAETAADELDRAARLRMESAELLMESAELQRTEAEDHAAQAAILRLHTSNSVRT